MKTDDKFKLLELTCKILVVATGLLALYLSAGQTDWKEPAEITTGGVPQK